MHGHLPHPVSPATVSSFSDAFLSKKGKRRGSYNCGRCGQPKKGHVCHVPDSTSASVTPSASSTRSLKQPSGSEMTLADVTPAVVTDSPLCTVRSVLKQKQNPSSSIRRTSSVVEMTSADVTPVCSVRSVKQQRPYSNLRRALSFDDVDLELDLDVNESDDDVEDEVNEEVNDVDDVDDVEIGCGNMTVSCLWEVMRRLPPASLLTAAKVCKGWRDVSKRLWKAAEELRLKVPVNIQVGYVGSVLHKSPALVRLSLTMQSDMDSTMLACIAFACPKLESLEIFMCEGSFNRITGEELGRFVADKRYLTTLKMEGCSNLGAFVLCSNALSTLWLSDLHSLSKMVFNLPNLNEISLDFSRQENDSTDLTSMMDGLGRSCPKLKNIHIASLHLSHSVVLSLTAAQLRELRMLSLVLGSEITDASVVAISKCYSDLELLDLSGSSISDSGLGMICNVFPETLTRLLVALCPNITSSGIQFAMAQLPLLELMDCGMTISESEAQCPTSEENGDSELQTSPNNKAHLTYQKLFIKHNRLKKLSLWGCSSLDSLYLSCPNLSDLNLNSCKNLIPEKLVLQCPKVESVHAIGCQDALIQAVQTQILSDYAPLEDRYSRKRMADGSKRVGIPFSFSQQLPDYDKNGWETRKQRRCTVQVE